MVVMMSFLGERAEWMLKDVLPGSVLVGVDGETLSVENSDRLMVKVREWSTSTGGSSCSSNSDHAEAGDDNASLSPPLSPLSSNLVEGEVLLPLPPAGIDKALKEPSSNLPATHLDESLLPLTNSETSPGSGSTLPTALYPGAQDETVVDPPIAPPAPPTTTTTVEPFIPDTVMAKALHLTFRLPPTRLEDNDAYPRMGRPSSSSMESSGGRGHVEEESQMKAMDEFKARVDDEGLPEGLLYHFLGMADWDIARAIAQVSKIGRSYCYCSR